MWFNILHSSAQVRPERERLATGACEKQVCARLRVRAVAHVHADLVCDDADHDCLATHSLTAHITSLHNFPKMTSLPSMCADVRETMAAKKALVLFKGTGSVDRVLAQMGYEVVSVDWLENEHREGVRGNPEITRVHRA